MGVDRRGLLGMAGAAALVAGAARAQEPQAAPSAAERLTLRVHEAARAALKPLDFDGARFSGAGFDFLAAEAKAARQFLIGEQHGLAEIPVLTGDLYEAGGYERLCVEVSPAGAVALDKAARGGLDGLRTFMTDGAGAAFYGQKTEAELLVRLRRRAGTRPLVWGVDYEISNFQHHLRPLRAEAPARARPALDALIAEAEAAWSDVVTKRDLRRFPSFALDPELAAAARRAWPKAPEPAAWVLESVETTLRINRLWTGGDNHGSNALRNAHNRDNLWRWVRKEGGTGPRVLHKFGGTHAARGLNGFGNPDVGNAALELAALQGGTSFHVMVAGALKGQKRAQFDPVSMRYHPMEEPGVWGALAPVLEAVAPSDRASVLDLRPLRRVVHLQPAADPRLVQALGWFDAAVILPAATPSENL